MRKKSRHHTQSLSLDSLVDIVSNNVGILIILAVFTALFALHQGEQGNASATDKTSVEPPPVKLEIPWAHPTAKNPVYFLIHKNRILHLDLRDFYSQLAQQDVNPEKLPLTIFQPGFSTRLFPVTSHVYCLEFLPEPQAGETWLEAREPGSHLNAALQRFPGEKFYAFFWVTGDSFELFRDVRKKLNEKNMEVGWKPSLNTANPEICNGFDASNTFQPQ
ncbi:MAG: hypothetical protein OEW12_04325 [Deltaproteobacteria bacterium]|nr:hypothetical protein [Deltaproteobacteria bacterium]